MDNNEKKINENIEENTTEQVAENTEITESTESQPQSEQPAKAEKKNEKQKKAKNKTVRNQFLFKRGGYSVLITALVLAALVLLNWLVAALGDRFHLEFDMTPEKINSMSSENIEFIKNIEQDVNIAVCASENSYTTYMNYYAQYYGISDSSSEYFDQTVTLINKYRSYNKRIKVNFIDPQTSEFMQISQKYSNSSITYGDIIVSAVKGENERSKILTFTDVYDITTDDTYAAYGYTVSTLNGNNIETALTGAIAYCISTKTPKAVVYTGHSSADYSSSYVELLQKNNFEVDVLSDVIIKEIPSEYDLIAIMAPTGDFVDSELDAISKFLDNGGKLSKSLVYFADSSCPSLPNLESFLSQWGINVEEGVVFETSADYSSPEDPYTMIILPETENDEKSFDNTILTDINYVVAGYNVPLSVGKAAESTIKTNAVMTTSPYAVTAPVGSAADWSGYTEDDMKTYASVIEAKKADYDSDNNEIASYVYAFGSVEYIQSTWAENERVSNKNIVLACSERAANVEDTGISFISKTITNETFSDMVTSKSSSIIAIVFIGVLPLIMLVLCIVVYIKRRNA